MWLRPYWLALTVPLFVVSVWLVIRTALSLTRRVRGSVVASVPLLERQSLTLPDSGAYALFVEGKRMSRDFGGLDFSMEDRDGRGVPMHAAVVRTSVSGFSRVRLQVRSFYLSSPGSVTLHIVGIRPISDPENRIVIGRPFTGALVAHVLALIALGLLTIAALGASITLLVSNFSSTSR
jgi:hypothetical protein